MLVYQSFDLPKVVGRNSPVPCEGNRIEPELTLFSRHAYMDMRRLVGFIGIEVKTVRTNA
jgi:hypothetical protein